MEGKPSPEEDAVKVARLYEAVTNKIELPVDGPFIDNLRAWLDKEDTVSSQAGTQAYILANALTNVHDFLGDTSVGVAKVGRSVVILRTFLGHEFDPLNPLDGV